MAIAQDVLDDEIVIAPFKKVYNTVCQCSEANSKLYNIMICLTSNIVDYSLIEIDPQDLRLYGQFSCNDYTEMHKIIKESIEHKLKYRESTSHTIRDLAVEFKENPTLENFKAIIEIFRESASIINEMGNEYYNISLVTSSQVFKDVSKQLKQIGYVAQNAIIEYTISAQRVTAEHADKINIIKSDLSYTGISIRMIIHDMCDLFSTVPLFFDPNVELPDPIIPTIPFSHVTEPKRLKRSLNLEPMEVS